MNKIKTSEPRVIWNSKCKLGEGTLWVKEHNSIYFVDIKKSVNVRGKCDANEAVYLMHVMMPNPNFKAVVRTGTYTRLFKDRGLAKKYFKKLCKTKNYKNIKLLPKPLFKL